MRESSISSYSSTATLKKVRANDKDKHLILLVAFCTSWIMVITESGVISE